MKECPIFTTYTAAKKIWRETEALIEELQANTVSFGNGRLAVNKSKWGEADDWSYYWCNLLLDIQVESRKPKSRWLTLQFDLARASQEGAAKTWPYARQALLAVGFDPRPSGSTWAGYGLISAHGTLVETEAWNACKSHKFSGGRLLEWSELALGKQWSERAWLFATPLYQIKNHDDVADQLIGPIYGLLVDNKMDALNKSNAVIWG